MNHHIANDDDWMVLYMQHPIAGLCAKYKVLYNATYHNRKQALHHNDIQVKSKFSSSTF